MYQPQPATLGAGPTWQRVHLVLGLQQKDVRGVHAEQLQQVEHGHDEVEERVAKAAHKVVQGCVHGDRGGRVGVSLWDAPMQHLRYIRRL